MPPLQARIPPGRLAQPADHRRAGFSLVEISLAVGIIAFAVLPLIGLLSIGLDSYRNAVVQARATQVLSEIATSLRGAVPSTNSSSAPVGTYVALAPLPQPNASPGSLPAGASWTAVTWAPATASATTPAAREYTLYFDENGTLISDIAAILSSPGAAAPPAGARLAAGLLVTPPTTSYTAGTAQITVGWPATPVSGPFYNSPSLRYGSVQGHVETTISLPPISAAQ